MTHAHASDITAEQLDEIARWLNESTTEDGHDPRMATFQLIYCEDPYPYVDGTQLADDELVARGLFRPFEERTANADSWKTTLGRLVVLYLAEQRPATTPRDILRLNAGAVESRVARSTKTVVTLYKSVDAGLDEEAGAWATVCEPHGAIVHHDTRRVAREWLACPEGWCPVCSGQETQEDFTP